MVEFFNGYALLIGVGKDLPTTAKGATALRDLLVDPSRAAYDPQNVILLTEKDANRTKILDGLDKLILNTTQNPDATVIISYSGHGGRLTESGKSTTYYLVPYNFDKKDLANTAVTGAEFTNKIEEIKARKLVIFLDCCHAGGVPMAEEMGFPLTPAPLPPELLRILEMGSGRVIMASSHEKEFSYTSPFYTAFTDSLLEAMTGKAVVKKDGFARILDILRYLFEEVPLRTDGKQHPFLNKILDLGENFPLCYYAGGSKNFLGEPAEPESEPLTANMTARKRARLEARRDAIEGEWDIRTQKLKRLREAAGREAGIAVKFQLEKEFLMEEGFLSRLDSELDEIEQALK